MKNNIKTKIFVTPYIHDTNIIYKIILRKLYIKALKKINEKKFSKIFDFGSGYQNLKIINSEFYNFDYNDFDPIRDKKNIFDIIENLDNTSIFVALNVFMYLEKNLIDKILLYLSKKKIKLLLNISKDYSFKKQILLVFKSYSDSFKDTLSYNQQLELVEKKYKIIDKDNMFFSDLIFCEPKD